MVTTPKSLILVFEYLVLNWLLVGVSELRSVHLQPTLDGPFFAVARRTCPRRTRPLGCSRRVRAHPLPPRHLLSSLPLINSDCCCHLGRRLAFVKALRWPLILELRHHLPYDFHSLSGLQTSPYVLRLPVHFEQL